MNIWNLPGPLTYITSIEKALRDGCNVISATPIHTVTGLAEALRCRFLDDGWTVRGPFQDVLENPLDFLYQALDVPDIGSNRRSISTLLSNLEPGALVIIDSLPPNQWIEWKLFLSEYEAASRGVPRSERPLLLVVTSGVPLAELGDNGAALKIFPWQNVIGEFDMMLFVLPSLIAVTRRSRSVRLQARIIARLAMWDFDLAMQLTSCYDTLLFEPVKALQWAMETLDPASWMIATWESGGRMLIDDIQQEHSYLLLADPLGHKKLRLRLWEAQASDFFPLIEKKRHELAQHMRPFVRLPIKLGEQSFSEIDELEIGQLAFLAHSLSLKPSLRKSAEKLRRCRNKLAHMEPLSHSESYDISSM